ncbi:substrate-binding domain-containing protein [Helcococcus kunzii]|uniref:substrate-binding domain-containing protein n=1 Tax=Helcococcus kunzii TaxID=40091 RepID=UPI0024AD53A6|nr:substrate-binding domain-containing protein [Helcococcus kunzii]
MKKQRIGLILLLSVIVFAGIYLFIQNNKKPEVKIDGLIGGEKIGLVENEIFKENIKKNYGLTFDYRKAGSLEMVHENNEKYDYLFPSSQLALQLYQKNGGKYRKQDIVFNTPIVLYSRKPVVDKLVEQKVVSKQNDVYYVDMPAFAELLKKGTKWSEIGLKDLYGPMVVDTTDPNKSNSGNMFLGLLANSLNGGEVVRKSDLDTIKPIIKNIYQQIGIMQSSSSDMFNQFLKQGVGAYPIIAGYENQILEFSKLEPDIYKQIKDQIVVMYPSPTVWSSHVYIALTEKGEIGLDSLLSKNTQEIAWKDHGFRTIVAGTESKGAFDVPGVPESISKVMPMPDIDVMNELMNTLLEE